jgi:hypothetical protein
MKSPAFYIILDLFFIILSLLLCSGFLYLLKQDDGTSLPWPVILAPLGVGLASLCLCIALASLADSIYFFMKRKRKKPDEKNVYSILD